MWGSLRSVFPGLLCALCLQSHLTDGHGQHCLTLKLHSGCIHRRNATFSDHSSNLRIIFYRSHTLFCTFNSWPPLLAFIIWSQCVSHPCPLRWWAFFIGLPSADKWIVWLYRLNVNSLLLFRFLFFSSKNLLHFIKLCEHARGKYLWHTCEGQLMGGGPLSPLDGSRDWTQATRSDGKHLHLLSQLSGHQASIL